MEKIKEEQSYVKRQWSNESIEMLLKLWGQHEELYNVKHPHYQNKHRRWLALKEMSFKLSKLRPFTNPDDIKHKMNIIRTQYGSDLKRFTAEENRLPTIWWFDLAGFLNKHIKPRRECKTQNEISNDEFLQHYQQSNSSTENSQSNYDDTMLNKYQYILPKQLPLNNTNKNETLPSIPELQKPTVPSPKAIKVENLCFENNFAELTKLIPKPQAVEQPKSITGKRKFDAESENPPPPQKFYTNTQNDDEFDIVGRNVAVKLRNMKRRQRVFAEKLISDILYYGQLEHLGLSSSIMICDDTNDLEYENRNDSDDDPLNYVDVTTDADSTKVE